MVVTIPLHRRPMFQGIFGAIFGIASVMGPLVGGAFTTKVSWRWCFYINLPIGAVVIAIILFIMDNKPSKNTDTLRQQIIKLDPFGTIVFLPGIVCLLLALQWGGTTYAWSSARIIVLFILAGILLIIFGVIQFKSGDNATVPIHIIKQRSIASGMFYSLVGPGSMIVTIYFLPLWFQAIKGVSAVTSGIDTLPLVLALVVASIMSGVITAKTGYYTGQLIACSVIMSVGAGLLITLTPSTNKSHWIGYEFIYGFGLGLGMQQAGMAAQTCLGKKDVMTGVALMFFMQGLGGSVFVTIAQTVFTHSLVDHLSSVAKGITNINLTPAMIVNTGATDLGNIVPAQYLGEVLVAYNHALSDALKVGLACAVATILAGLTMEWKSVKGLRQGGPQKVEEVKEDAVTVEPGHGSDTEVETTPVTANSEKL